jgi:hypothetical protein
MLCEFKVYDKWVNKVAFETLYGILKCYFIDWNVDISRFIYPSDFLQGLEFIAAHYSLFHYSAPFLPYQLFIQPTFRACSITYKPPTSTASHHYRLCGPSDGHVSHLGSHSYMQIHLYNTSFPCFFFFFKINWKILYVFNSTILELYP